MELRRPGVLPDRDHRRGARAHRRATGKPFVDVVLDQAEQKGTGRWTVQIALDLGVPVTGIAEAVFARSLSGHADQRAAARGAARPGRRRRPSPDRDAFVEDVRQALYASKVVAYAQGFDEIRAAAPSTAGTSTSARWRRSGGAAASSGPGSSTGSRRRTTSDPNLPSLLVDDVLRATRWRTAQEAWRRVVAHGRAAVGIPTPGLLLVAGVLRRRCGPTGCRPR